MSGNILIAMLVGFVMAPVLIWVTRDLESKPASRFWIAGWSLMWLSSVAALFTAATPAIRLLATTAWFAGAGCQLAGARAFVGRPNSRGLALLATAIGCLGVGAQLPLTGPEAALAASLASAPVLGFAAWLVARHAWGRTGSTVERLLGAGLVGVALFDAVDWSIPTAPSLYGAWGVAAVAVGMLQVLAIAERDRRSMQSFAEEREVLRRIALAVGEPDFGNRLIEALRPTRYHDLFRGFGVWVRTGDSDRIEHIAGKSAGGERLPDAIRISSLDRPIVRAAIESDGPLFIEDLRQDPRVVDPVRASSPGQGFVAALRVEDEVIGTIGGVMKRGDNLDEQTRSFVADLADQIALVVAATKLREDSERQAERLDADQRMLRAMTEAVPTGIIMTDPEGTILLMNESVCRMFGLGSPEDWLERDARDLVTATPAKPADPEALRQLVAEFAASRLRSLDQRSLQFDNGVTVEVTARPVLSDRATHLGRVWVIRDVTEERALGERLQQADRMQTLGTLAGGLAHDFNNQLTAIMGNAALLSGALGDHPDQRAPLDDLERAAAHCADLTQGLLAFARQEPIAAGATDVAEAIADVRTLLTPTMPPGVRFEVDIETEIGAVSAGESQLHRVLTNLVMNARDAVGARGTIRLEASKAPGDHVRLSVTDDGCGMDEATRRRIFDPFFTTKGEHGGTGLGLAVVYGVVETHGGSIEVDSEPGKGSRFSILWPVSTAHDADAPAASWPVTGSGGTILVAEDEAAIRRLVAGALEDAGFQVVEAADGNAAAEAAERNTIDAALLDLSMPGPDGIETLERIRCFHPDLPGLIMTGRPERADGRPWPPDAPVLLKPFSPAQLVARVCELVASGAD